MNEGNYSDAHCFPTAYKALGIGETGGMQVPGISRKSAPPRDTAAGRSWLNGGRPSAFEKGEAATFPPGRPGGSSVPRATRRSKYAELRNLLLRLGFEERTGGGSHAVFRRAGVEELINLQRDGKHAKVYQVRQVRSVLLRYRLGRDL